jgi:hypothetical protein
MTVLDLDPTGAAGVEVTELAQEIMEFAYGTEGSHDPDAGGRGSG